MLFFLLPLQHNFKPYSITVKLTFMKKTNYTQFYDAVMMTYQMEYILNEKYLGNKKWEFWRNPEKHKDMVPYWFIPLFEALLLKRICLYKNIDNLL